MKKLLLLLSLFVCVAAFGQDLTKIINDVKKEYAPDKRTAVFDVKEVPTNGPVVLSGRTNLPQAKTDLLARAQREGIEVLDAIKVLPDTAELEGKTYGVVRIAVGTLRYGPSYASEQATQLLLGTPVKILEKDGWYLVQTPEDYISWVSTSAIQPMTRDEYNAYVAQPKVIYLADAGWAYKEPDAASQRVTDVVAGCILLDKGTKGKYVRVGLPDGREAYVPKSEVTDYAQWVQNVTPTKENIVNTAYRFMGVSYLWAGTSVKMLDCSGFSKTVYMLNGLILARDASQQCLTGENIDVSDGYKNLQAGDLVFFGSKDRYGEPERVWHVGIYVGDGRFIHEAGDVHENSFNPSHPDYSKYYVDRLVRATRIIGTEDKGLGVTSFRKNPYYAVQE